MGKPIDADIFGSALKSHCWWLPHDAIKIRRRFRYEREKTRHTVWLTSGAWSQVEDSYTKDNCTTKNEYIEKAIRFYTGYLNTQNAASYLPRVLADVLDGKLGALGMRIGKLLFKLAVEQDMIANITAAVNEIPLDDVERLRARCMKEIRQTNGVIDLEDAIRYQNGGSEQWSG